MDNKQCPGNTEDVYNGVDDNGNHIMRCGECGMMISEEQDRQTIMRLWKLWHEVHKPKPNQLQTAGSYYFPHKIGE